MEFKRLDTQGWRIQLERTVYPLVRIKKCSGYKLSKDVRLIALAAKKVSFYDRMAQQPGYPKGRLKHLKDQIRRLEYYVDVAAL